jgi:hypothetical protein
MIRSNLVHIAGLSDDGPTCWCHSTLTHRPALTSGPESHVIDRHFLNRQ